MLKSPKLYKHQIDALSFLATKPKALLCLDAGLGKTAIAIKTFKPGERILVITPATLKINWFKEIEIWQDHKFKIQIIRKKREELSRDKNLVTIINYDILGGRKNKKIVPNFNFRKFDRVIVDEFHMIKNQNAIRTRIAAKIIKTTPNAILLSGTPGERSAHLYVPLFATGAIDMKWSKYADKFCEPKQIFLGSRTIMTYNGATNTEELKELMRKNTLVMHKEDVIDLPKKDIQVVRLDLPVDKREANYDLFEILNDRRPLSFEGLAELLHDQGVRKVPLASSHIKMRLEIYKKIFVVTVHREVTDLLMEKLKKFNPVKLDGRDKLEDKQKAVDTFQKDKNCRVFIGQIKASGVGVTLTKSHHIIFVENNWSFSDLSQAIDRLHRISQKVDVTAEILTIADSIDDKILYKTLEKEKFVKDLFYE